MTTSSRQLIYRRCQLQPSVAVLPDYLKPGLDVVFVGLNPSLKSAEVGHYYAGPGNQFWPFLYEAGFTDRRLRPDEDGLLLSYGIGLTDFVKRTTRGIGDLPDTEFGDGLGGVQSKIEQFRPRIVCFNGKSGYQATAGNCDYGLHDKDWDSIPLYVAPSTSGALPMKRDEKLAHYMAVKAILEE